MLNNFFNRIYKKRSIIFSSLIIFSITIFFNVFCVGFGMDEVWNYGFSNNIYNGMIPYKDFNMIVTPFYPYFISIFFHLFGNNFILFHIINSIIVTIMFYYLGKLIGEKKWLLFIFMVINSILLPSYNMFLLFVFVLIFYLEENNYNDYLIGFIMSIAFLTKQSVGGVLFIIGILFYIRSPKKMVKRIIGFIPLNLIFLFYLLVTRSLYEFLDLCFFGLFDFSEKNSNFGILSIILVVFFIINLVIAIKDKKRIINWYVLGFISIAIPLMDYPHMCNYLVVFLLLVFYNINIDIRYNKYIKIFSLFSLCGVLLLCLSQVDFSLYPNNINHFRYRYISKENIDFSNGFSNYINDHSDDKFVFLFTISYYMKIVNDMDIGKLDLINYGNFGYNGTEKIIKEIMKHKDSKFIIRKNSTDQTDREVIYYVMKNGVKIDSINSLYDVYVFE